MGKRYDRRYWDAEDPDAQEGFSVVKAEAEASLKGADAFIVVTGFVAGPGRYDVRTTGATKMVPTVPFLQESMRVLRRLLREAKESEHGQA